MVSDVRQIAETAHKHGIPLIVDEAHGAHFRFSDYFPVSATDLGADVVIQSFHKTLPAMTQTAVLHLCSERAVSYTHLDVYKRQVHADEAYMDKNNKFQLNQSKLMVYSHGEYLGLGKKLGTFGYSVKKGKKHNQKLKNHPLKNRTQ